MTMAGQTSKLVRKSSNINMLGRQQESGASTKHLTRQASNTSLMGFKGSVGASTKVQQIKEKHLENEVAKATLETPSSTNVSVLPDEKYEDLDKKLKKLKKKKGKFSFKEVVEMKMQERKPLKKLSSDQEEFKNSVLEKVHETIHAVSVNGEASIGVNNVLTLLRLLDIDTSNDSILDLLRRAISEKSGRIDLGDLDVTIMKHLEAKKGSDVDSCVISAFKLIDQDQDGYITKADIKRLMTSLDQADTDDVIDEMMKAVSPDQEGSISLKDFSLFLLGKDLTSRRGTVTEANKSITLPANTISKGEDSAVEEKPSLANIVSSLTAKNPGDETQEKKAPVASAKRRNFFGGNFKAREDKKLEGMFNGIQKSEQNGLENSSSNEEKETAVSEADLITQETNMQKKDNNRSDRCLDNGIDENSGRDAYDFEKGTDDESSDDVTIFPPEIYIRINNWRRMACVEETMNEDSHNEDDGNDQRIDEVKGSVSESSQSETTGFESMPETNKGEDYDTLGAHKNCAWPMEVTNANYPMVDKVTNMTSQSRRRKEREKTSNNENRNNDIDDGISLEREISRGYLDKPEFVQRWLSSPGETSPRPTDDHYNTPSIRGKDSLNITTQDGVTGNSRLISVSVNQSKSNFSDLRRSLDTLQSDESFEDMGHDDNTHSLGLIKLGVSLSYRSELNLDTPNTPRTELNQRDPIPSAPTPTNHRPESSLERNCSSSLSFRRSLTPPNKIPLPFKTIEVHELELNAPVTANLFSNRTQFGSLPKDVSKFLVFRKTSSDPGDKRSSHNFSHQTHSSTLHFKKLSKTNVSPRKMREKIQNQSNRSHLRNSESYNIEKTNEKYSQQNHVPPENLAPHLNDRIQSLQLLLLKETNRIHETKKSQTQANSTKIHQSSTKNLITSVCHNPAPASTSVLDSLKIEPQGRLFQTFPPNHLPFRKTPRKEPNIKMEASVSISRKLQETGRTYKMSSTAITQQTTSSLLARSCHPLTGFSFDKETMTSLRHANKTTPSTVSSPGGVQGGNLMSKIRPLYSARSDSACLRRSGIITLQLPSSITRR